jgi:cyclic pyranopterin phosphate synthase
VTGAPLRLRDLLTRTAPASAPIRGVLADAHGRIKRKLRISLTDRCNFRCRYCMPEQPQWLPRASLLSAAELLTLARLFVAELGVTQIRLTGGEPLLRRDLAGIVAGLAELRPLGLERISLTTNGALLERRAGALRAAGLDDVNVSLDARTPEVFRALTGADVAPVLRGIDAARAAGLPTKVNTVVVRGYNDAEIVPLARWAHDAGVELRLIEFMPLDGRGFWSREKVVTQQELLDTLAPYFGIEALARDASPAARYRLGAGSLGIIATVSNPFCATCDRVRLTADGQLYACLFSAAGADLRGPLRAGADDAVLAARIRAAIWHKEAGYVAQPGYVQRPITMHHLGG